MAELDEWHLSAKFRDVMRRLANRQIDTLIPPDEFGVVVTVDDPANLAEVLLTGTEDTIFVSFVGVAPEVDDIIRITGRAGSRYIAGSGGSLAGAGGGDDEDVEGGEIISYDSGTGIASVLLDNGDTVDVTILPSASEAGAMGPQGTQIYNGTGAPSGALGVNGDYYFDTDSLEVYHKTSGSWAVLFQLDDKETSLAAASVTTTYTADYADARVHDLTLGANLTLTLDGATVGRACAIVVYFTQDATGGRTLTYADPVLWPGGVVPPLSTAANATDIYVYETLDGGATWYGNKAGGAYS